MKRIFLATVILASATAFTTNAQTQTANTTPMSASDKANETAVSADALPDAVKATLASEAYAKSKVTNAAVVKQGDKEVYKVELADGDNKQTVLFDKNGQPVK
jgi:hypothetical protein